MKHILVLICSPHGTSNSGQPVVDALLNRLGSRYPDAKILLRLLYAPGFSFPDADYAHAVLDNASADDPAFTLSETLINELEMSDALVIATPMHNFAIPASLKAWIDYVLRIHRTFTPTPSGKIGKLRDRPVFVIVSSGGFHHGDKANQPDFLTPYLNYTLDTIGIKSIHYLYLQGLAYGAEIQETNIAQGMKQIETLV